MNRAAPGAEGPVLVTGASGFIGSRLAERLSGEGLRVFGVARRPPPPGAPDLEWRLGDLAEEAFVEALFAEVRPALVFHLASHVVGARDLDVVRPTFRDILAATVNVLLAAARHGRPRVVLTGSMEEPEPGDPVPSSPYAAAKLACAAYANLFHTLYQLPVINARVFMVYGPGQRDRRKLIPYTILSLLAGRAPEVTSGERPVDWIYVDDVVEGLYALGRRPDLAGRRVDLGSGQLVPVRTVVEHLTRMLRPDLQPRFGALPARPLEQVRRADVETTFRVLGWRPQTSLEEGLRKTAQWYAEHREA